MNENIRALSKYFVIPAVIAVMLFFFMPTLYNTTLTRVLFIVIGLLGIFSLFLSAMNFVQDGNLKKYMLSITFFILAIFSTFSALGFLVSSTTVVAWLVQVGTLLASLMFLAIAFHPDKTIKENDRFHMAFTYVISGVLLAGIMILLIMTYGDSLPAVSNSNWGTGLFEVRALSAMAFLASGIVIHNNTKKHKEDSAALLLLSVGSFAVAAIYLMELSVINSLITFNRVITILALIVFFYGKKLKI